MQPIKYRVVSSTKPEFLNIEMFMLFDDPKPGKQCEVFGERFTITQTGILIVLVSDSWVMTLENIEPPEPEKEWGGTIRNAEDLRINFEVEVYTAPDKKFIRLNETDRLNEEYGVTMKALAKFLIKEWTRIQSSTGVSCPVGWDEQYQVMYLRDGWNMADLASIALTREGSFTRYDESGNCVNP